MLSLLPCPDAACDAPAEITAAVTLESTHGPVTHVKTQCVRRHIFVMPLPPDSFSIPCRQPTGSGDAGILSDDSLTG
jgi:hypothetical protein